MIALENTMKSRNKIMELPNQWAPVILFVYNRIECTRKTLKALEENELAEESELYIFSDGAKYKQDIQRVEEVRNYIGKYSEQSRFRKTTIIKATRNKGLANSVIEGVTDIIERFGKVIVLEDDCVTTKDFLRYMNEALDFYETKDKIWSVTGYTSQFPKLKNYSKDVYLAYRGSSLGWGTWKDRWETVDWNVCDYKSFWFNVKKRRKFARGGNGLFSMLKAQMNGKIDSWAIRWCYAQSMQDKYTVYPKISYLCNIGFEEGVHSTPEMEDKYRTILSDGIYVCKFEDIDLDEELMRDMNNLWNLNLHSRIAGFIQLEIRTLRKKISKHQEI